MHTFVYPAAGDDYTSPESIEGTIRIDAEELITLVREKEHLIIIDSRIRSDRRQGYIPGSVSLPDTITNCGSLASIIPDKSSETVFYCNGPKCRRSDNAVMIAVDCGYKKVYWFRGGIEAWGNGKYPINK